MRIAGIGCRPGTPPEILAAVIMGAGAAALATIPAREAELRPVATLLNLPLHLVEVAGVATPTRSPRVLDTFGTGSVAEAAAIAASRDRGGRLIQPRQAFGPVTIAIAEVP